MNERQRQLLKAQKLRRQGTALVQMGIALWLLAIGLTLTVFIGIVAWALITN